MWKNSGPGVQTRSRRRPCDLARRKTQAMQPLRQPRKAERRGSAARAAAAVARAGRLGAAAAATAQVPRW